MGRERQMSGHGTERPEPLGRAKHVRGKMHPGRGVLELEGISDSVYNTAIK